MLNQKIEAIIKELEEYNSNISGNFQKKIL